MKRTSRAKRPAAPDALGDAPSLVEAGLDGLRPEVRPFANRILRGDCLEVLAGLPDASVDLVFADPPYNLQLESGLYRPNQTLVDGVDDAWDKFESFAAYDTFTRRWLTEVRRVMKPDATIWVIGSYHNIFRVGTILMDLGFWVLNDVHWYKTNPMPNFRGTRFTNATETMIWAKRSREQKRYTFQYQAMKHLNEELQMQNVWELPLCMGEERLKVDGKKAHATQKPEALLFRVLMSSSNPGDLVLDPFSGTGTTAAVAKKLQRHFIGVEREEAYAALSEQRLAAIKEVLEVGLLRTPSKRDRARVKFGALLELGLLSVGAELCSRDGAQRAIVAADGTLRCGDGFVGSIHAAGAHVQGAPACNGWDFWHVEREDGGRERLDSLRDAARERQTGASDEQAT
jgi:modification methylase